MDIILQAFVTLFVVVDPLGVAAVFSSLSKDMDERAVRVTAIRAAVLATLILLVFGFAGNVLLTNLHVSVPAFQIAGGLLLFVTAFRMLMGFHDPDQLETEEGVYKDRSDLAVFPLAIPFLAGPGCMTAVMLMMVSTHAFLDKVSVAGVVIVVEVIALFCMLGASRLVRMFGASASSLLARIMGVLMAAMAVQFIADGAKGLF